MLIWHLTKQIIFRNSIAFSSRRDVLKHKTIYEEDLAQLLKLADPWGSLKIKKGAFSLYVYLFHLKAVWSFTWGPVQTWDGDWVKSIPLWLFTGSGSCSYCSVICAWELSMLSMLAWYSEELWISNRVAIVQVGMGVPPFRGLLPAPGQQGSPAPNSDDQHLHLPLLWDV